MQGQDLTQPDNEVHRQKLVLWIALLSSVVMYFVVIRMVPSSATGASPSLETGLLVAAVGLVGVSFLLKSRLARRLESEASSQAEMTAHAIPLILCESAALVGVVVHFITGSPSATYFLLVGLIGMLLHYPRRDG